MGDDVRVRIGADTKGFRAGLASTRKDLARWKTDVRKEMTAAFEGAGAGIQRGAAKMRSGLRVLDNVADAAGRIVDASRELDISEENFQRLTRVFEETGVGADQMTAGLTKFNNLLGEARGEGEAAADAQERLAAAGLEWNDVVGGKLPDNLGKVADKMKEIATQAERVSLSRDLFGRGGPALLQVLRQGKAAMFGAMNEADVISGQALRALDEQQEKLAAKGKNAAGKTIDTLTGFTAEPFKPTKPGTTDIESPLEAKERAEAEERTLKAAEIMKDVAEERGRRQEEDDNKHLTLLEREEKLQRQIASITAEQEKTQDDLTRAKLEQLKVDKEGQLSEVRAQAQAATEELKAARQFMNDSATRGEIDARKHKLLTPAETRHQERLDEMREARAERAGRGQAADREIARQSRNGAISEEAKKAIRDKVNKSADRTRNGNMEENVQAIRDKFERIQST